MAGRGSIIRKRELAQRRARRPKQRKGFHPSSHRSMLRLGWFWWVFIAALSFMIVILFIR